MISETLQFILTLASLLIPLLAALALAMTRWSARVMAATPLTALPAIALVFLGQTEISVSLPWMQQHTFLQLDQIGRVFLDFISGLWSAIWPLLVGGGLAALGAWLRKRISADPARWLPAGDIGVVFERWLNRLNPTQSNQAESHIHATKVTLTKTESPWQNRLKSMALLLSQIESSLKNWTLIGLFILVFIGIMLLMMTAGAG